MYGSIILESGKEICAVQVLIVGSREKEPLSSPINISMREDKQQKTNGGHCCWRTRDSSRSTCVLTAPGFFLPDWKVPAKVHVTHSIDSNNSRPQEKSRLAHSRYDSSIILGLIPLMFTNSLTQISLELFGMLELH